MVLRRSLLVLAWLLGGIAAVALATAAVSRVGNEVTGDRPSPLSADEVAAELAAEATGTTSGPPGAATPPDAGTASSLPPPSTALAPPTTTAPPTTEPAGEVRTYALVGGTATLRFAPAGVTVVTANPNPGYQVELEPAHGSGVEVSFEGNHHKSQVEGWWDGGPRDQVEEEDDD